MLKKIYNVGKGKSEFDLDIPKELQKLVFDGVSLAINFCSSLVPCYSAMVARSRTKIYAAFLPKFQLLSHLWYSGLNAKKLKVGKRDEKKRKSGII
ncbi:MAG TPA: hypothetical protein VGJ00_02475 [Rhabdochlamydiaceae bacterium]